MSAIAGIYEPEQGNSILEQGNRLMRSLSAFPCDASHGWHNGAVFLGCHNQWITPESVGESNPRFDTELNLSITADAIIDNRAELFSLLQVNTAERGTMTDCELIALAYRKWGTAAPQYLIGDFAFMIWDALEGRMFGARDFSGSRTLYYNWNGSRFAFCTIIEPLLALPGVNEELNEQWLAQYLAIAATVDCMDTSITVYRHIAQLQPSHSITIEGNQIILDRYCRLTAGERLRLRSNEQYVEAFREVYQEAVSSRLRTHKGVGAQLSGGLDSGSVVGFAANALRGTGKTLQTFSYVPIEGFIDYTPGYQIPNEKAFIQSTVRHVGGIEDHYFDFAGKDPYTEIDGMLETMEMPYKFYRNSFWLKGMFEEAGKRGLGILLNGGRGNLTISWGEAIPYYADLLKKLRWIKMMRGLKKLSMTMGTGRAALLSSVGREAFPVIEKLRPILQTYQLPPLIHPEFARRTNVYEKLSEYGIDDTGWLTVKNAFDNRRDHFEQTCYWNTSNTIASKLSLRYGVWKRDPTNDLRVIRFCLSLPEEQYVRDGMNRALIRSASEQILPDDVRLNHRKKGVQSADWLQRMESGWQSFIDELREMTADRSFLELVDETVVKAAYAKLLEGVSPSHANEPHLKTLMYSLVAYRFLRERI